MSNTTDQEQDLLDLFRAMPLINSKPGSRWAAPCSLVDLTETWGARLTCTSESKKAAAPLLPRSPIKFIGFPIAFVYRLSYSPPMPQRSGADGRDEMALFEIKHRLTVAVLFKLETESLKMCVETAVKRSADLRDADLRDEDLRDADLGGADLSGAVLGGAVLGDADLRGIKGVIALGAPDGWPAHAWLRDGWLSIRVGCQEKRIDEARAYWAGKDNRREVMAALDYAEAVAVLRGWAITAPAVEVAA